MAIGKDIRGAATSGRGYAAKMALDDEERKRQLMATPPIQFRQPAPQKRQLAPEPDPRQEQQKEINQAVANDQTRTDIENVLRIGGAAAGLFGAPTWIPLAVEGGIQAGKAAFKGEAQKLKEEQGGPSDTGSRVLAGTAAATQALSAYDAQQAKFDEEAIGVQLDAAIAKRTPRGMAEAEFLSTDVGRRAYLGKSYGRDPSYMSVFEEWLDRNR
tara:strand:+ start:42 stop:683 length:642 start_codon:yes stop_codon:yes gene_type:complete